MRRLVQPTGVLGALGPSEVAVLLDGTTRAAAAEVALLVVTHDLDDPPRPLCGVAAFPESGHAADAVLSAARAAAAATRLEAPVAIAPPRSRRADALRSAASRASPGARAAPARPEALLMSEATDPAKPEDAPRTDTPATPDDDERVDEASEDSFPGERPADVGAVDGPARRGLGGHDAPTERPAPSHAARRGSGGGRPRRFLRSASAMARSIGSQGEPERSLIVAGAAPVHDAGDGRLGVEPRGRERDAERDEERLAGEQALVGRDEHPALREVEDAAPDEPEIPLAHDLAAHADGVARGTAALGEALRAVGEGGHVGQQHGGLRRGAGAEGPAPD